jgi:ketosteroid isomerase-like protein
MTPQEQLELVKRHYAFQAAGDHAAAEELLTEDFFIIIPSVMPFAGLFRGKKAFRELIPLVAETVAVTKMEFVATTVGDDRVVEIVEVNRFRENQICEIRPFYCDPAPWIEAARR